MAVGPLKRVADSSQARRLLGWAPEARLRNGRRRPIVRHFRSKERNQVEAVLDRVLPER